MKSTSPPGSQCSVLTHYLTFRGSESFVLLLLFSCVGVCECAEVTILEPICIICSSFSFFFELSLQKWSSSVLGWLLNHFILDSH